MLAKDGVWSCCEIFWLLDDLKNMFSFADKIDALTSKLV